MSIDWIAIISVAVGVALGAWLAIKRGLKDLENLDKWVE